MTSKSPDSGQSSHIDDLDKAQAVKLTTTTTNTQASQQNQQAASGDTGDDSNHYSSRKEMDSHNRFQDENGSSFEGHEADEFSSYTSCVSGARINSGRSSRTTENSTNLATHSEMPPLPSSKTRKSYLLRKPSPVHDHASSSVDLSYSVDIDYEDPDGFQSRATNLIVNYLPPYMSQEEVKALFSSVGEVESCKLVREKTTGESLGYAFVKYVKSSNADKAVRTLNGLRLQNKTIKVSYARPSSESIKGANLYICGLPKRMTQNELENLFGECGRIITARILYDNRTGFSRGVAFIRFDHRFEAEMAIKRFNGYRLPCDHSEQYNEPITVKFANSPASMRQHEGFGLANLFKQAMHWQNAIMRPLLNPFNATGRGRANTNQNQSSLGAGDFLVNSLLAPAIAASSGALSPNGWCIFVYNLGPETDESHLWQIFGPFGAVQSVKVARDNTFKCRGFAFVTMSNYEEAVMAINALNGMMLGSRMLQVSFKTSSSMKMRMGLNGALFEDFSGSNDSVSGLNSSFMEVPAYTPARTGKLSGKRNPGSKSLIGNVVNQTDLSENEQEARACQNTGDSEKTVQTNEPRSVSSRELYEEN